MTELPSPQKMAALVSGVTQTMCGVTFVPDEKHSIDGALLRTAVLPIPGARPITVGISSDETSLSALSAAMFAVPPEQLDAAMMNDSLCEIVNMTAGLLKSVLSLNQQLGLPKILSGAAAVPVPPESSHVVVLRAQTLGLTLWIYEGVAWGGS
jgi:hypothetical protein